MIVDLLRNDLGRICEFGSVQVEELFAVEKYATLLQMASEISGRLRTGVGYADIFGSLFPCGSITGAPKLRTMKIIQELERGAARSLHGGDRFLFPGAGGGVQRGDSDRGVGRRQRYDGRGQRHRHRFTGGR